MAHSDSGKARRGNTKVDEALNGYLADTYLLMVKTQACHWNATGSNFFGIHKLTEAQYTELFAAVDDLAERVRALGTRAPVSMKAMLNLASLDETDGVKSTKDAVEMLAADNAAISARAKALAMQAEEAEDLATHDMLTHRIEVHDKAAWLLRSHLD